MPKPYLWHPAAVHFPIALLLAGLAAALASSRGKGKSCLADAASWLLWLGTASAWAAAGLGLLAAKTAPHVPPAWRTLAEHRHLAFWTVALFTALSLWRIFWRERRPRLFLLAWLCASAVLLSTAFHGGELVFSYNMGTEASAE
ncbi:MAG: DUF2231 domain-containing protein [Elusimicrobia bacterium]|nr:DUF2231 domain-containing protein [Elusimicrobiota bacterium]MDE2236572.1 DUF2231 domain-containing protein [Elusimicrobiota bacterium]MDE2424794.1 DUF2231 domain-containing protein [Elusimicrobiota bacterium]